MKRFFLVMALCAVVIGASAQKKVVAELTEEVNALKTQVAELKAVEESNKVLAEQLQTMVSAYKNLENAYKSNSEQITLLTSKIDELTSALGDADIINTKPKYEVKGVIMEGLAVVKEGLLYGYVNAKGEYVITPQFESAESFSEGLAAVKINDKWGYIDKTGKLVIAAKYLNACDFVCGEAMVQEPVPGEDGYYYTRTINKSGKVIK